VMKHASAERVQLRLSVAAGAVLLEVSDDGVGFDPATTAKRTGPMGYGLSGMQQRAELLGGQLTADSTPGRGTIVRLRVPVAPDHCRTATMRQDSRSPDHQNSTC
jgi:signal transduction histidine kinase